MPSKTSRRINITRHQKGRRTQSWPFYVVCLLPLWSTWKMFCCRGKWCCQLFVHCLITSDSLRPYVFFCPPSRVLLWRKVRTIPLPWKVRQGSNYFRKLWMWSIFCHFHWPEKIWQNKTQFLGRNCQSYLRARESLASGESISITWSRCQTVHVRYNTTKLVEVYKICKLES